MAGGLSCFLMYLGYFVVPQRVSWCFIVSFDISFSHCVSWCWVCCQHEHFVPSNQKGVASMATMLTQRLLLSSMGLVSSQGPGIENISNDKF